MTSSDPSPAEEPVGAPCAGVDRLSRNAPCWCGSHRKYKRCCQGRDQRAALREDAGALPDWVTTSSQKLWLFVKYAVRVFGLVEVLVSLRDTRQRPQHSTLAVVTCLFFAALLRRPSINATEGDLKQEGFQALIGRKPIRGAKAFSAEVISNVLDKLDLQGLRNGIEDGIWRAERNKAFRAGSYGALRCVAIDGWEPFSSYDRHCAFCLTRQVSVKNPATGEIEKRTQYFHRCVVALFVGPVLDLVLDVEPVLNAQARRDLGEDARHEGELTAAHRLIARLHATYGSFIDAIVFDALYANGPIMAKLEACGYGGFIVLKKEDNQPLKEALALWKGTGPCQQIDDEQTKEHVEFWDVDDIDALDTFKGKARVIRAVITRKNGTRSTWCIAVIGDRARKLARRTALTIVRSRWHIENTCFCQWVKHWNLGRVYRHTNNAILAVILLWALVFNLLQLFIYRRLKRPRKPTDPCDTIIAIVAEMFRTVGAVTARMPWEVLAHASLRPG